MEPPPTTCQKMYKTVGSSTQHKVRMFIQTILFVLT